MTKKTARAFGFAAPLALLVPILTACHEQGTAHPSTAGEPGAATYLPPTSAPAAGSSTEASAHGVDPAAALLDAAETIRLTETQHETVLALRTRLATYEQNARTALHALREDVASQVRAGAIRATTLTDDESRAAGALTVHVDEGAEAMNALYKVLDSSQRAAIVATVRATQHGSAEVRPPAARRQAMGTCRDRVARVAPQLALDPAQERRVLVLLLELPATASLGDERQRRIDAIVDGFGRSNFDGWTIVPAPLAPPAESLRQSVDCEVAFFEKLLPILRPDQRERLASILEARPAGPFSPDEESGL